MGMNNESRAALAKIEGLLAMVVGVQKMQHMTMPEFLMHAHSEIAKAQEEPQQRSAVRLSLLYKSVLYTSAIIEDAESDAVKVPVFVVDQTTFGEQSNELKTPDQSAAMNPGKGTFFEGGLQKFLDNFAKQVEGLKGLVGKVGEDTPEDDDTQGKRGGKKPEETETEKSLPDDAFLYVGKAGRKFPFKKPDGEVDTDKLKKAIGDIAKADDLEDDEKEKLATKAQRMLDAKKKVGKGLAKGEVAWPDDMNDEGFVKKGHQEDGDWGTDDRPL